MKETLYRFHKEISQVVYVPLFFGIFLAFFGVIFLNAAFISLATLTVWVGFLYFSFFPPHSFNYEIALHEGYIIIEDYKKGKQRLNLPFKIIFFDKKLLLDDGSTKLLIFYDKKLLQFLEEISLGN